MVRPRMPRGLMVHAVLIGACAAPAIGASAPDETQREASSSGASLRAVDAPHGDGARGSGGLAGAPSVLAILPGAPKSALAAVLTPSLYALRADAQARFLGTELIEDQTGKPRLDDAIPLDASGKPCWTDGNALGAFVPIENEQALGFFHRALTELASGRDRDGKVRILAYGASHTQGDVYTGYLRHYFQSRFGDGGPGFLPLSPLNQWYKNPEFKILSEGLQVQHAQHAPVPEHGRFGLLGAASVGGRGAAMTHVMPRSPASPGGATTQFELFYSTQPGGGDLQVRIDGQQIGSLLAGATTVPETRYYRFTGPSEWQDVVVQRASYGSVRLYGVAIENSGPGIVVDTLGISGTRATNMLKWNESVWGEHLQRRNPDLVTLAYGTNEATDLAQTAEQYRQQLTEVLQRLRRAVPRASCLLIGPGDFPKQHNGSWQTRPRLLEIIEVQRQVSREMGCGFWDAFAFMGGEGSMLTWSKAKPRMGASDHVHLTTRGYVRMGLSLGDALLRSYDATLTAAESNAGQTAVWPGL